MNGRRGVGLVLLVVLLVMAALGLSFVLRGPAQGHERTAEVTTPGAVGRLSFNRLWGSIAEATGVESEGAIAQGFSVSWNADGSLRGLRFRALTADGILLQAGYIGNGSPDVPVRVSVYGSEAGSEIRPTFSGVPLDELFLVLDALGLPSFEPLLGDAPPDDFYELISGSLSTSGSGDVLWMEKTFRREGAEFVRIHPTDTKGRTYGSATVLLAGTVMRSQKAGGPAAGVAATTTGPSSTAAPRTTNTVAQSGGWSSTTFTYFLVPVSEVR
jgi:hypothetical protein